MSAVDRYLHKQRELARMHDTSGLGGSTAFGTLLILGIVSAVESYLRELLRRVVRVDKRSHDNCLGLMLPFGAVESLSHEMMPEALLENVTFSSSKSIAGALKQFLQIGSENLASHPEAVQKVLIDFGQLCQMRHCAVHRFGRLGVKNALQLGMEAHSTCIEKPLAMPYAQVQNAFVVGENLVLQLNGYLFNRLLERTIEDQLWSWDLRIDKRLFKNYYDIFASQLAPPTPPLSLSDAYREFREFRGRTAVGS